MNKFIEIFFSNSLKLERIRTMIDEIANTEVPVLLEGEKGVGKEFVAMEIHLKSHRNEKPFLKTDCSAVPVNLIEGELFGVEKGAFSGAQVEKPGKFELANGGTLLLNDIEKIDISLQEKILSFLQDGSFSRSGSDTVDVAVNTRLLVATQENLKKYAMEGRFQEDLFFRINVVNITVPPLRERKEQIIPFAQFYLDFYQNKYSRPIPSLSAKMLKVLTTYDWPGNIQELENAIKNIVLVGEEAAIKDLMENGSDYRLEPAEPDNDDPNGDWIETMDLKEVGRKAAEIAEKKMILDTLKETRWNRKEAARLLGVSYKTFLYRVKRYRLEKNKR